jgi:hypothetical protein
VENVPVTTKQRDLETGDKQAEFLKNLISNFDDMVTNFLDSAARDAITKQKTFTDEKEFKRVKLAIEERVLYLLLNESQLSGLPVVGFFRKVVGVLANRYPYMFLDDPKVTIQGVTFRQFEGKGTGGVTGINSLPKSMQQKFGRMQDKKLGIVKQPKKRAGDDGAEPQAPKKKKRVYGIGHEKYYCAGTDEKEVFLGEVDFVTTTEEREAMYSEHRKDIQHSLVNGVDIFTAVPGFFTSLTHALRHFEWLTGKNLETSIEGSLPRQFKIIQAVTQAMCSTKEFRLKLEIARIKGSELNGSLIPELICLLRQLNTEWHKNPGGLFRFPTEPEIHSPHIFCPQGTESLKFELHVENNPIYTNLNFSEVLSAFFCITFIGNIHYPKDGESSAILLQRKVAGINADGN